MTRVASSPTSLRMALAVLACGVLLVPIQVALGYLSVRAASPIPWLIGAPLAFFLVAGFGAYLVDDGDASLAVARARGARLGLLASVVGIVLAALLAGLFTGSVLSLPLPPQFTFPSWVSRDLYPLIVIFVMIPGLLTMNLAGIALAPLGGLIGSVAKVHVWSRTEPALNELTRRGGAPRRTLPPEG